MLSDNELLDLDASDNIFVRNKPQEDSPRTFSRCSINCLGLLSKEGPETAINNTQSDNIIIYIHAMGNVKLTPLLIELQTVPHKHCLVLSRTATLLKLKHITLL